MNQKQRVKLPKQIKKSVETTTTALPDCSERLDAAEQSLAAIDRILEEDYATTTEEGAEVISDSRAIAAQRAASDEAFVRAFKQEGEQ